MSASRPQDLAARRVQLNDLLHEQWEYTLRTSPEFATILGDKRYNDKWSDNAEKAVYADLAERKKFLKKFDAVDTTGFPEQEVLNKQLMIRGLQRQLDNSHFHNWLMPVTQFSGVHIDLPQFVSLIPSCAKTRPRAITFSAMTSIGVRPGVGTRTPSIVWTFRSLTPRVESVRRQSV